MRSIVLVLLAAGVACQVPATAPPPNTPASETFVFDNDTLVPFGVAYNIAGHVRWIVRNAAGDSVGTTALARVSSVSYVATLGKSNPGTCRVLTGTFVAYCPDGGTPATGPSFTSNGYWLATADPKAVSGIAATPGVVRWYVNSNLPGSQPLTFAVQSSSITEDAWPGSKSDTINFTSSSHIRVQTAGGETVATVPVLGLDSLTYLTAASEQNCYEGGESALGTDLPPCGVNGTCALIAPTVLTCLSMVVAGDEGLGGYTMLAKINAGPFNGVNNSAVTDTVTLVAPSGPVLAAVDPVTDTITVGQVVQFSGVVYDQANVPDANPLTGGGIVSSWALCPVGFTPANSGGFSPPCAASGGVPPNVASDSIASIVADSTYQHVTVTGLAPGTVQVYTTVPYPVGPPAHLSSATVVVVANSTSGSRLLSRRP